MSSVESPTEITLQNNTGSTVTVQRGMRLILLSDPPELYSDPFGTDSLGSSVSTDTNGRVLAYIDEDWFDYVVSGMPVTVDSVSSETLTGGTTP